MAAETGFVTQGNAQLYYEVDGATDAPPLVFIHAGIADSRMWDDQFSHFAQDYRVLRFDMRGHGKSAPAPGEYTFMQGLIAVLDHVGMTQPINLVGCSMGGALAISFTIAHPQRVKKLVMVGSGPDGMDIEVEEAPQFAEVMSLFEKGRLDDADLDRINELMIQVFVDGRGRTQDQVNAEVRRKVLEMNAIALRYETGGVGERKASVDFKSAERLGDIAIPVCIVYGDRDEDYAFKAADYMNERIKDARVAVIKDVAHLPNMEHPNEFNRILTDFLDDA